MSDIRELDEPILADDYPMHASYWYVVDGVPIRATSSRTVGQFKANSGASEVRRCAAVRRKLPMFF